MSYEDNEKYLKKIKEKTEEKKKELQKKDTFVDYVEFKSIPNKKNGTLYLSQVNRPVNLKDNAGFVGKLLFRFSKDNTTGMAAQLAYYFLLAIFPALIFLLSIVPMFNVDADNLTNMINQYAPEQISGLLDGIINEVMNTKSGGLFSIGLILTLWSASNGMNQLMNAFNVAYDIEDTRNPIVARILSVIFTILLALAVVGTFVFTILGDSIGNFMFGSIGLDEEFQWIWNLVRTVLPVIIVFIVFLLVYTLAPSIKVKLKSVIPGTLFSTIVFLLISAGFGFYVSNFSNYTATYGSIAGVIILIFWLYITSIVLILGAQINSLIHKKIVSKKTDQKVYSV
ncbi:YihY/virulence factor BrkB family protein [Phocicoccus pinnipedialis]|uniref:Uncharacterized protein n=1 Tax=Phocicoccus pinnipedialis TaxID=110845 RepID=A0A6V7RPF9_9BACL|nr:YihY/virulence factor BrkB family protein [Jeotgalicoccus pinnipedialis]MBP1940241.1 membrane protein [Jeotgalicoccus pinnipedialis]CAD2079538.1 hypothetical protein JEOPIN946_01585 [Jeotgalicoccus pinnipedialis]